MRGKINHSPFQRFSLFSDLSVTTEGKKISCSLVSWEKVTRGLARFCLPLLCVQRGCWVRAKRKEKKAAQGRTLWCLPIIPHLTYLVEKAGSSYGKAAIFLPGAEGDSKESSLWPPWEVVPSPTTKARITEQAWMQTQPRCPLVTRWVHSDAADPEAR